MKDLQLHLEQYVPAQGATVVTGILDLGIDNPGVSLPGVGNTSFSNMWRLGYIRVEIPAMAAATNNAQNLTITFTDSGDGGVTFQQGGTGTAAGLPLVQISLPGVAANGTADTTFGVPVPPGTRGPIQFSITTPNAYGVIAGALVTFDWVNEV